MKLSKKFSRWFVALWFIPLVINFTYVYRFGVNMPWMDQFNFIPLLKEPLPEVFFSHEFFLQHNEHKMFFPRFIMVLLAHQTRYNVVIEMYFIQFLLLGSLGIFFLELRRYFSSRLNGRFFLCLLPIPFLVFSLRQHLNFLLGFQIQQALVLLLGLLSFHLIECLRSSSSTRIYGIFSGALISAFLASFSSAGGLLVWPVACVQLFLVNVKKSQKRGLIVTWATFGLATWFLYFFHYQKPSLHPSTLFALHHPGQGIEFFFAYIGGAVFKDISYAIVVGLILVAVTGFSLILLYQKGQIRDSSFWLAVLALAYITAFSAVVSRSGFGIARATVSKYSTFSIPILVVLYVLHVKFCLSKEKTRNCFQLGLLLGLILLGVFGSAGGALKYAKREQNKRLQTAQAFRNWRNSTESELSAAHPETALVVQGAEVLENLHYSVFSDEVCQRGH